MPTQIQLPASVSTPAQWGVTGSDPSCVQTNDGDTSTIYTTNQSYEHLYLMDAFPAGVIDPVDACSTHLWIKTVDGDAGAYFSWDGDSYVDIGARGTSYADQGTTYYSLVKADITAGKCGVKSPASGSVSGRVTMIYRRVDYHTAAGGLIFLLGSLAGAAVGLHELAGLASETFRRTRVLIRPDEYEALWRELREWRYPVHFIP